MAPLRTYRMIRGRDVEHGLPVLLKRLLAQDLREDVSGVGLAGDVAHRHNASATKLSHLEELAVYVP